jgi:hypothetical protein
MSGFGRLSSTSPNPVTRAVLRAGRVDEPSAEGRHRTAVALGVAGGVMAATTGTAGAAGAAGGTGIAASKWASTAVLVKWLAAGLAGSAVAVSAVHEYRVVTHPPPGSTTTVATLSAPARPVPKPLVTHVAGPASASSASEPALPKADAPKPRAVAPTPAVQASKLRDEMDALDGARAALGSGDATRALEALGAHDRAYPHGALAEEGAILRVEALAQAGKTQAAMNEARQFLAQHPDSPHARRARSVLAAGAAPGGR